MKRALFFSTITLIIVVSLSGCSLLSGGGNQSASIDQTAIALGVAQTQFAASQTVAAIPPTLQPSATVAIPTLDPFTPTPSMTVTPVYTPTLDGVWLTVVENTNCRSGPGSVFEFRGLILEGQQVEAIARTTLNEYYYIKNPTSYGGFCWLWSRYSTITGDTSTLTVLTPQPTPTNTPVPTEVCQPPAAGCPSFFFWDKDQCKCRTFIIFTLAPLPGP